MPSNFESVSARTTDAGLDVEFRPGAEDDIPLLMTFIRSMAAFEKLDVTATEATLRESLFGADPAAQAVLICAHGSPIGYLIYFFSFTSMMGRRALWLEDLFIEPKFRGHGIGAAAMSYLASIAIESRCARFEWIVLDWNDRAIDFYQRLGATILPNWRICRLQGAQLEEIAKGTHGQPGLDHSS